MERVDKPWPELGRGEAAAYLETFVAEQKARRARLREVIGRDGDVDVAELDASMESLPTLWAWTRPRLAFHPDYDPDAVPPTILGEDDLPPLEDLPTWVGGDVRDAARFTPDTLWLIDMVAREFAAVLQGVNADARWRVGHARRAGYIDQNRPVLRWGAGDCNPLRLVTTAVSRELQGMEPDDFELYEIAEVWTDRLPP